MKELQSGQIAKINFTISSVKDESIVCRIKRVETDRIALVFPEGKREFIRDLPEGKEINAVIYTNSGIFVFDSIVINSPLEQDFVIELPAEKQRIQRREYVRAPMSLRLVLKKDSSDFETSTINIGGGGIRFISQENIEKDHLWGFLLHLPDKTVLRGTGRVLYTLLQSGHVASVIVFSEISETDRNRLIKLCFDEEIKNIKAKKGSDDRR